MGLILQPDIGAGLKPPRSVFDIQPDALAPGTLAPVAGLSSKRRSRRPLLIALILIIIFAGRIPRLNRFEMDVDEVWTIWQTFGTPAQIVEWTPYDWLPLSYLTVGAWTSVVGIRPLAVRMLMTLNILLVCALLYLFVRRLFNIKIALLALLSFAGFAYSIYLSVLVRGYGLILMLTLLTLNLTLTYFEDNRRNTAKTVLLTLALTCCIAAMFYIHPSSIYAMVLIGWFSLLRYGRAIWRWIFPSLLAGLLALPGIEFRSQIASRNLSLLGKVTLIPMGHELIGFYSDFWGNLAPLFALLLLISVMLILWNIARQRRRIAVRNAPLLLITWSGWIALPVVLYPLLQTLGMFSGRHLAVTLIGLAIIIGWGLSLLPRPLPGLAAVLMLPLALQPIPQYFTGGTPPMLSIFNWLSSHMRSGDVLLVDPNADTAPPEMVDYFDRAYFPQGLPIITNPQGYRRIWYAMKTGSQDPILFNAVKDHRIARDFVGPWNLLFRLYEAPPDVTGTLFENGIRFHGVDTLDPNLTVWHKGEDVHLRLWWSVSQPVTLDYSLGLYLLDSSGKVILHTDDAPHVVDADGNPAPRETSRWLSGQYYLSDQIVHLPELSGPALTGRFTFAVTLYQYWDNKRFDAPGANADKLLPVQVINIKAW